MQYRDGTVASRNDLGLPGLGARNHHEFPQWLQEIGGRNGLDFDTEAADIRAGRNRAAAKLLASWFSG